MAKKTRKSWRRRREALTRSKGEVGERKATAGKPWRGGREAM
jgi:hypothetical protein